MEALVVLLVIGLIIANSNSSKKKKAQQAGNAPKAEKRRADRPAQPVAGAQAARPVASAASAEEDFQIALDLLDRELEAARAMSDADIPQGASMLPDDECAGGSMAHTHAQGRSAHADDECIGGSMAHTHTEGVSRAAHARRMAAIDADHETSDAQSGAFDARDLRRAVVMAEVLGKPKALRRAQRPGM